MGSSLPHYNPHDSRATTFTRLSFAVVDLVLQLESTLAALRVDVVRYGGSPVLYGFPKNVLNLCEEPFHTGTSQISGKFSRVDPRSPKRLVHVNVSQTADNVLIQ